MSNKIDINELPLHIREQLLKKKHYPLFQFVNVDNGFGCSHKGFVFNEGGNHLTLTLLKVYKQGKEINLFRIYLFGYSLKIEFEGKE